MESLENLNFSTEVFISYALTYGPRIVGALATLVLGLWVVSILVGLVKRLLKRSKVDPSLASFLASLMSILMKVLVYITALGVLGYQIIFLQVFL